MGFLSICVHLCLLYFLVSTDKGLGNTTESLSSSFSSSLPLSASSSSSSSPFSASSCSPHSFVFQKTTTTKDCSNCVLVPVEVLQNLLEMTNAMIKDFQPKEPEESADLDVEDEVPHLPSMEGSSRGSESCNHRLLLALWESETKNLQLKKEINKQKEETNNYKEELERKMEEKDQLMRDCHPNPHHRHPRHRHRPYHHQPTSIPGAHPQSMASDSAAITRFDLQDIKHVILDAITDMRDNGRSDRQDIKESILDELIDIKNNGIVCKEKEQEKQKQGWPPKDCYDLFELRGERKSGVYTIYPLKDADEAQGVSVWCDMGEEAVGDGGDGWTVILQRRHLPHPVLFNRTWGEYRDGFGSPDTEYWIGNEVLHQLTTLGKPQALRIDMEDFDGVRKFASYGRFSVGGKEDNFRLSVGMFSSTSTVKGDSLAHHNSMEFSTFDRDNDQYSSGNCVASWGDGGFWMKSCHNMNPTAPIRGKGKRAGDMNFQGFNNDRTTLKKLTMKIRPSE